jgi:hypothetical protein
MSSAETLLHRETFHGLDRAGVREASTALALDLLLDRLS